MYYFDPAVSNTDGITCIDVPMVGTPSSPDEYDAATVAISAFDNDLR